MRLLSVFRTTSHLGATVRRGGAWPGRDPEGLVVERGHRLRLMLQIVDEGIEVDEIEVLRTPNGCAEAETTSTSELEVIHDHGVFAPVIEWRAADPGGQQPRS